MASRIVRNVLALAVLAVPVALAACSSQAPESSSEADQAVTRCPLGTRLSCDTFDGPHGPITQCVCDPFDFYTVAHLPSAVGEDTCGTVEVAPPPALASQGCTWGVLVDNQPVWACPSGATIPSTLGVVHTPHPQPLPLCVWGEPWPFKGGWTPQSSTGAPCEAVEYFTQSTSNCIGNAPPGWKFVIDTEWTFVYQTWPDGGQGGGCQGQCAHPLPPMSKLGGYGIAP